MPRVQGLVAGTKLPIAKALHSRKTGRPSSGGRRDRRARYCAGTSWPTPVDCSCFSIAARAWRPCDASSQRSTPYTPKTDSWFATLSNKPGLYSRAHGEAVNRQEPTQGLHLEPRQSSAQRWGLREHRQSSGAILHILSPALTLIQLRSSPFRLRECCLEMSFLVDRSGPPCVGVKAAFESPERATSGRVNVEIKHVALVEIGVHERLLAPVVVSDLFQTSRASPPWIGTNHSEPDRDEYICWGPKNSCRFSRVGRKPSHRPRGQVVDRAGAGDSAVGRLMPSERGGGASDDQLGSSTFACISSSNPMYGHCACGSSSDGVCTLFLITSGFPRVIPPGNCHDNGFSLVGRRRGYEDVDAAALA